MSHGRSHSPDTTAHQARQQCAVTARSAMQNTIKELAPITAVFRLGIRMVPRRACEHAARLSSDGGCYP